MTDDLGVWTPLEPDAAAELLADAAFPWWVAGGWALDLYLGRVTRAHADLDVGLLRRDLPAACAVLRGWEIWIAQDGKLCALGDPEALEPEAHCLWCRTGSEAAWTLELLVEEGDRSRWVYRRDRRIARPLADTVRRTPAGVPYLAPEVQLLFKAKTPRPRDEADFEELLPHLDRPSRSWLAGALECAHAGHPWIERLR